MKKIHFVIPDEVRDPVSSLRMKNVPRIKCGVTYSCAGRRGIVRRNVEFCPAKHEKNYFVIPDKIRDPDKNFLMNTVPCIKCGVTLNCAA